MPAHWLYRYYWGIMLPYLCEAWGLRKSACPLLHEAFKDALEVESTKYFDEADFKNYIESIHLLLAVEFGLLVPYINEPPEVDDVDMATFLTLYK